MKKQTPAEASARNNEIASLALYKQLIAFGCRSRFCPGDKVVCTEDSFSESSYYMFSDLPVEGRLYSIREVDPFVRFGADGKHGGEAGVRLVGIYGQALENGVEAAFGPHRFRRVAEIRHARALQPDQNWTPPSKGSRIGEFEFRRLVAELVLKLKCQSWSRSLCREIVEEALVAAGRSGRYYGELNERLIAEAMANFSAGYRPKAHAVAELLDIPVQQVEELWNTIER